MKTHTAISFLLLGALCLPANPARAVDVEIGGFYAQVVGGAIGDAGIAGSEIRNVEVAEGSGHGMTVEFTLPNTWQLELIWDTQDSYLSGNVDNGGQTRLADTTISNYLFGGNYYFEQDAFRPYIGFHLGATNFKTEGLDSDTRFAFSFGGGAKYYLNDWLALDIRLRWVASYIDANSIVYCNLPGSCYVATSGDTMNQFHLTAGVNFRF